MFLNALVAIIGILLIALSLQDAFEVVLIPRRIQRQLRFTRSFFRVTWAVWSRAAVLFPAGSRREDFVGVFGPLSMVLLFSLWATCLIGGFACVQWTLQDQAAGHAIPFVSEVFMSGDAFFTLGYGDIVPRTHFARLLIILEAGTGFGFIALTVSYLPVLYQHFSQRDMHLIQLDIRAGSPASAEALLSWYVRVGGGLPALNAWLVSWEAWATEIIESHSSYPMLAFYRSQHSPHSWIASTGVVLDLSSFLVANLDEDCGVHVVTSFRAALRVLHEVCLSLGIRPGETRVQRLPPDVLQGIRTRLAQAGLKLTDADTAKADMEALRNAYEPMLVALSRYLLLPLPPWTLPYMSDVPAPALRRIDIMLSGLAGPAREDDAA